MFSQMENEWFDREVEPELVSASRVSRRPARRSTGLARAAFVALLLVGVAMVLLGARPAHAEEEVQIRRIGLGYKIGNGIGFTGGDIVLRLIPHVAFDLQAAYASIDGMTGYGLAPTIQLQWKEVGHTPYVGTGLQYANLSDATRGGYVTGFVVNAGYEWRFANGLGVLVGGGIQDLGAVHATKGTVVNDNPGGARFNIEAGVRYFF
jgi:hypothetical protein